MSEAESQYHPAIEKVMETSGPDIGRIKDTEIAREVAEIEDDYRSPEHPNYDSPVPLAERVDTSIKPRIALEAIKDSEFVKSVARNVAGAAAYNLQRESGGVSHTGEPLQELPEQTSFSKKLRQEADNDAKAAVKSYEDLAGDAKPAHAEEEAKRAEQRAAEARHTIEGENNAQK